MTPADNPHVLEARELLAPLRRAKQVRVTDADVPGVVRLLSLLRSSGLGQRAFAAAVGLSVSTLGAWLTGQRKYGSPWPALSDALGRPAYVKPAPVMTRHAVECRAFRARRRAAQQGAAHVSA